MDIWRLMAAALRRWYVLLVLLLAAAAGAYAAGQGVAPEYVANSSILLVPAPTSAPGNPYGDLGTATQAVLIVLQGPTARGQAASLGGSSDYDVTAVSRTPILNMVARAESPETAVATTRWLIDAAAAELASRQAAAGVPPMAQVSVQVLDSPSGTVESTSDRQQLRVIVLGVGGLIAFLSAVFLDDIVILIHRRRRAGGASADLTNGGGRSRHARGTAATAGSQHDKPVIAGTGDHVEHAFAKPAPALTNEQGDARSTERTPRPSAERAGAELTATGASSRDDG